MPASLKLSEANEAVGLSVRFPLMVSTEPAEGAMFKLPTIVIGAVIDCEPPVTVICDVPLLLKVRPLLPMAVMANPEVELLSLLPIRRLPRTTGTSSVTLTLAAAALFNTAVVVDPLGEGLGPVLQFPGVLQLPLATNQVAGPPADWTFRKSPVDV
jgi:hypothetical protein